MVLQLKTPENLVDVYIGIAIVRYALGAAVLTVNGGILLAFLLQKWRCRHRRPKQSILPSGCFVINLLVADTLVGAVLLNSLQYKIWPEYAVSLAKSHYSCLLRFALAFLGVCGSHNALLSVVIDRYVAVVHTLRYKDLLTTKTCALMIAASWVLPVTGWVYLMFFGNWRPNMPTCSENTVLGYFSLYVWLPIQIALLVSIVVIQVCVHVEIRSYGKAKSMHSSVLQRSSKKSARVMLISTIAFVVCYGPYDTAAMVFVFFPSASTKLFYDISAIGTALTFLINPCFYSFKTESIRRPVTELVKDIRGALARLFLTKEHRKPRQPDAVNGNTDNAFTVFKPNRTSSTVTLTTSVGALV